MNTLHRRLTSVAAAAASTTLLLGAVVLLFGQASRDDWLAGTDAQLAEVHRCKLSTPAPSHEACVKQVLAQADARRDRPTRLAHGGGR